MCQYQPGPLGYGGGCWARAVQEMSWASGVYISRDSQECNYHVARV
jgi:hypothetical protein